MDFEEKTIKSEYVFRGKVIDVKLDEVVVSNGHKSSREVVEHPGGVVILALKGDKILTVKQYRYPLKAISVELPAGKLERGENPDFASKRELEEETGYVAKSWKSLGCVYSSPGFCDEKLYLYLATDLVYKNQNPDEDEIIECYEYSSEEIYSMVDNGEISDAKTLCALLRARKYIND